jgi:hypothetical protein
MQINYFSFDTSLLMQRKLTHVSIDSAASLLTRANVIVGRYFFPGIETPRGA